MKKNIMLILTIILLGYIYNQNRQSLVLDYMMNVEALATGENSGYVICLEPGNVTCPTGAKVAYIMTLLQPY